VSQDNIILEILKKGELQVGDKERHAQLERVHNEVIDMVAARLVDPNSKRVYTTGIIEKALDQLSSQSHQPTQAPQSGSGTPPTGDPAEAKPKPKNLPTWTGVVTTKSAKSQALDAIKALIAHQPIPISRARMRLRITCPTNLLKQAVRSAPKSGGDGDDGPETKATGNIKERILSFVEEVESQDVNGSDWEVVGFVEPGSFRELTEFIGNNTKGKARAEVLDMAVIHEGDS
jgi:ribosome maturation protein SDO1